MWPHYFLLEAGRRLTAAVCSPQHSERLQRTRVRRLKLLLRETSAAVAGERRSESEQVERQLRTPPEKRVLVRPETPPPNMQMVQLDISSAI